MLPHKTALVVPSLDDARADPDFIDAAKLQAGEGGLIILSEARTAAASTILRDILPRSFVCDTSVLSLPRLNRLMQGANENKAPRFGLIVSNGYGLGHVARMQAVANGIKQFGPVAFMSFSAALVDGAFYLPSPQYLGLPDEDARLYVREAALRFINQFEPTHIMYDGNVLPTGLLAALAQRPDIHLTWLRRGQWQSDIDAKYMAQQALCDLVIEPGDLAETYDKGPTWQHRLEYCPPRAFLKTKPIRPANPPMLSRETVLTVLRLNPQDKHILLMPGASKNAEDIAVITQCAEAIKQNGAVPVIAHWPMAHMQAPTVEGAVVIETLPIAPYYPAFDAIVTAAGYNTFHEVLDAGVPVIFIPQEDTGRDQQLARAQWAVDRGLAALCRRPALHLLPELLAHLEMPKPFKIEWQNDWSEITKAMNVGNGLVSSILIMPPSMPNIKILKAMHRRWLSKNKPFHTHFVLALNIDAQSFLKKKIDRTSVIVTNSIDPVQLRRAGYQYLWLNGGSDYGVKRQFANWLRLWRPSHLRSI
ncbi:MAG TPA: glycosyltransferase [Alphaproteobacteria bacterium]